MNPIKTANQNIEIMAIDKQGKAIYDTAINSIDEAASGKISAAEAFLELNNGSDLLSTHRSKFGDINIPDSLLEFKDDISTIKSDASTAQYMSSEGLRAMAEYLNTNDMEKYQKASERLKGSNNYTLNVVANLFKLAEKVGVDPTTLPTD